MKNNFGTYLKKFLIKNNYKLEAFANKVGYSFGLIGHYINGRRSPSYKFIDTFFKKFNLSEEEKKIVLQLIEEDKMPNSLKKINKEQILDINSLELMKIPLYSSVGAGFSKETIYEPVDWIMIPKVKGNIIGILVSGNSMENTIMDGSTIIVKKNIPIEIGEVGVFLTKETDFSKGLVKRLRNKNGKYLLESDNKNYKDIEINSSEIIACGKVINVLNDTIKKTKDPLYSYIDKLDSNERKTIELMLKGLIKNKK